MSRRAAPRHLSGPAPDDVGHPPPVSGRPAVGDRHVVVIGMHRSGTSAAAGALAGLGLSTPDPADLLPPTDHNERGHWESRTLVDFHDACLRQLDASWSAPPALAAGWADAADPATEEMRARARALVASMLGRPPMVLKDPRLCLFLPLWRSVLPAPPVAVLMLRDPLASARSLLARDRLPVSVGVAIWDRYTRQAVAALAGLPVYALDYDAVVERPEPVLTDLVAFLGRHGIEIDPQRIGAAAADLAPDLRHQAEDGRNDDALDSPHRQLVDVLRGTLGPHRSWCPPALPDPPPWVDDLIGLLGQLRNARRELAAVRSSRILRVGDRLRRRAGRRPVLVPAAHPTPAATASPGVG